MRRRSRDEGRVKLFRQRNADVKVVEPAKPMNELEQVKASQQVRKVEPGGGR